MPEVRLSIADFCIDLINESAYPLALEEGYSSFVVGLNDSNADVKVVVRAEIPAPLKELGKTIYSADFEGKPLWKIEKSEHGLRFHVFSPEAPFQLQQVAELNTEMTTWTIYTESRLVDGENKLLPFLYPMGPLVMYYLTVKFDAIMIHGSGISDGGKGKIFTGVSGKGKTTMAKLWFEAGAKVLNDDRLIVRKIGSDYISHNTPMFYEDSPRSAPLQSIFSIHHASENTLNRVSGAQALAAVSPNLIQHGYSSEIISHHLNFVGEMIEHVSVFELGFKPDQDVVRKIRASEFNQA